MTTFALSPLRDVASLHDEVDRFLRAGNAGLTSAWMPAMDIAESEDGWEFTLELPGLTKDDVQITVENGNLVISGSSQRRDDESLAWRRVERRTGSFQRAVRLPERVDTTLVDASLRDGLLVVHLPKAEDAKPRTITIT